MLPEDFTKQHRNLGRTAAFAAFSLLIIYAVTLVLGLLSLKSPDDPIGDPFFSILELVILVLAPLLVIVMIAVHAYARSEVKAYSFTALILMIIMAGITCSVHFVVLTVSRQIEAAGFPWASLFFSFNWPSVVYTTDILAWDFFFGLSMLFAAPVFKIGLLEKTIRILMIICGVLSIVGLIGVPMANMIVRDIGVVGYVGFTLPVLLLLGIRFGRNQTV